jgi:hypothetical protein
MAKVVDGRSRAFKQFVIGRRKTGFAGQTPLYFDMQTDTTIGEGRKNSVIMPTTRKPG